METRLMSEVRMIRISMGLRRDFPSLATVETSDAGRREAERPGGLAVKNILPVRLAGIRHLA